MAVNHVHFRGVDESGKPKQKCQEGGLGGTLPELVLQDVDGLIQNVCDRLRQ